MPKTADEVFRDFTRFTGDGLPDEPVGHPLPYGDPKSGVWNPPKREIREVLGGVYDAAAAAIEAAAEVSGAVFTFGSVDTMLASAADFPLGTILLTREEGFSYEVVSSAPDMTTAGGDMLRVIGDEAIPDAYKLPTDADDTAALTKAFATGKTVRLMARDYVYSGSGITVASGQVIRGTAGNAGYSGSYDGSGSRIVATGTGTALFNGSTLTNHIRISGLVLYVSGAYDWVFDFDRMAGFDLADMRVETTQNGTGGIRTQKAATTDSSWVLNWSNVRIRLPDTATARTVDIDMSDGGIIGSDFTGGAGARFAGTGGLKIVGNRFDRSTGYGITINAVTESRIQHIIANNQIEENDSGGILVNADANDGRTETWIMPTITGNAFRNRVTAVADIVLVNNTGAVVFGGTITGNTHSNAIPAIQQPTTWRGVNVSGGQQYNTGAASDYAGGFRQSPLILMQGAGNTAASGTSETTVLTVPIPANTMKTRGVLRARLKFSHNNNANAKTIRVRLGSLLIASLDAASGLTSAVDIEVHNSSVSTQIVFPAGLNNGVSATAVVDGAINTALAQDLTVSIQLANGADAAALRAWTVTLTPQE